MKAPVSTRIWYACMAAFLWIGIYLTGFSIVSWILYLPAAGLSVASIVGICPTQVMAMRVLGKKQQGSASR